jgi:hypothetical protein
MRAQSQTLPAPVGGWNLQDPLSLMDPIYATSLINVLPKEQYCELRGGSQRVVILGSQIAGNTIQGIAAYGDTHLLAFSIVCRHFFLPLLTLTNSSLASFSLYHKHSVSG